MDHAGCMKHICDSIWIFPDCDCCRCRCHVVVTSREGVSLSPPRGSDLWTLVMQTVGGVEIKGRLNVHWWISLGVLFQHTVLLLSTGRVLLFCFIPIPSPLDAVNVLAASLRCDLRYGLRVQLWVLLLYDLPLRVLHYVGVVLAAVGEGGLLEVVAAVGVGEEKDLGHVDRVERLTQVLLALHLQPWQLGRG